MKTFLSYIAFVCCLNAFAQQTPAPKQTKDIAILGAKAHIGNGTVIENSVIILSDGRITNIVNGDVVKLNLTNIDVINANGKHVYPGFILPNSTLGLVEIDAVKASDDEKEMGAWNPHIRSLIAYNAESKIVESLRPNGVLIGQITPQGGRMSGTSSVVQFDAWNWEDAAIKVNDALHLNWPSNFSASHAFFSNTRTGISANENYNEQIKEIETYFQNAIAYNKGDKKPTNLPFASMEGLFNGNQKLFIHVNEEKGIIDAVNFCKTFQLNNVVIVGGKEAYKTIDILKENNIPVVLNRVHSLPDSDDDDYNLPYKTARLLVNQGITVCLDSSGDMERMSSRNLPFYAGTTVTYGLSQEQALQLITLNAAKVLRIDTDYGSLEKGKSATLFISEGDALDMKTNAISHAFIDGRQISLETHQTELWKRYSEKLKTK
ncbi:amidohydrolase family protein [Aestuariibaculum lutulentum]|uniref:Amidohydrolase family protein n=1 Tax=Aestuariibaculum lutulentum TaxID=2920935 RepID=A0ABS9RF87_9FLAO|nr:amidohydrolase family protein [Aestuariibaculum lutulentum]MCH4551156.1 amidohydrolase family protein [Aestuariibaculum lutulentum]